MNRERAFSVLLETLLRCLSPAWMYRGGAKCGRDSSLDRLTLVYALELQSGGLRLRTCSSWMPALNASMSSSCYVYLGASGWGVRIGEEVWAKGGSQGMLKFSRYSAPCLKFV